jgi:hypothetical protein
MPLKIRVNNGEGWKDAGTVGPKDPPGSLSDHKADRNNVYVFTCSPQDTASRIFRSKKPFVEYDNTRIIGAGDLEVIAELRRGGPSFELQITLRESEVVAVRDVAVRFEHV